ncbi:MAG: DUF2093 domain-containing protein [Alphaproteobacteria bacterium]|nr:DUF2093 domain-containing protein [Alphaproteobacteria bacterium]
MNETPILNGQAAELIYDDGQFHVRTAGTHVLCAVTGRPISLTELKYWSVERQEPYATAAIGLKRMQELSAARKREG